MPLAPGTRLGPYEVTAPLGAGGVEDPFGSDPAPDSVPVQVVRKRSTLLARQDR